MTFVSNTDEGKYIFLTNEFFFQIIEDFAENDETKNLEFGKKLEEIINLMES